jgi:hypothetical protein
MGSEQNLNGPTDQLSFLIGFAAGRGLLCRILKEHIADAAERLDRLRAVVRQARRPHHLRLCLHRLDGWEFVPVARSITRCSTQLAGSGRSSRSSIMP